MSKDCLPKDIEKKHGDWIPGLRWVPRWWFAKCGKNWPMPPKRLLGKSHDTHDRVDGRILWVKPIPQPGNFILSAVMYRGWIPFPYLAKTWKDEQFFYIGTRWDDTQNKQQPKQYYELFLMRASGWKGIVSLWSIFLLILTFWFYVFRFLLSLI